MSRKKQ